MHVIKGYLYYPLEAIDASHWEGNIKDGKYIYLPDLISMSEQAEPLPPVPQFLEGISSPLSERLPVWKALLESHPDERLKCFVLEGLEKGFRIGFQQGHYHRSSTHNLLSCKEHPETVQEYIEKECSLGRLLGPFPPSAIPNLHVSPFGVIPKKATDKWRLIVDLSAPRRASINDGIPQEIASLSYVTIDMIGEKVRSLGKGTMLAKLDVKSAFRIVPVHPADRMLLGMQWNGYWYADAVLPFGLRSAPKLFNVIADAVQFVARSQGIQHVTHYLDDFIVLGCAGTNQCERDLKVLVSICECLGVPLAGEKLEGPATRLEILGIIVDTEAMQLSLSERKIAELLTLLREWQDKKVSTKRDVQSLAGKLQHAAKVVRPGRCFVWHIYGLTSVKGGPDQPVRFNYRARSDIQWWLAFLEDWNGVSLYWKPIRDSPDVEVWSDASGSWGCGALTDSRWFIFQWPEVLQPLSIAHKEAIPIVIAGYLWGQHWSGKVIRFSSDNKAVVDVLNNLYCKDAVLMCYLRCLVFCAASHNFWFTAKHIPGKKNVLADAISRNKVDVFLSQAPKKMKKIPDTIPQDLTQLLCLPKPDWMCRTWRELFRGIMRRA